MKKCLFKKLFQITKMRILKSYLSVNYTPKRFEIPENVKCLCLAPHQDDETIGMGGTLARYNKNFKVLCLTNGAKGIKTVSSVTRDGLSLLKIELQWKTDINLALIECRELIDQSYEILPNGCAKPSVRIFNPYSKETIMLTIIPKDNDLEYSRYLVENDIKPRLQRISGVSSISIAGGDKSEIRVIPNKTKMESM